MTKKHSADWDQLADDPLAKVESAPEGTVRVRCTSHMKPWTDKKELAYGEEADVPEAIADTLVGNGVAVRI